MLPVFGQGVWVGAILLPIDLIQTLLSVINRNIIVICPIWRLLIGPINGLVLPIAVLTTSVRLPNVGEHFTVLHNQAFRSHNSFILYVGFKIMSSKDFPSFINKTIPERNLFNQFRNLDVFNFIPNFSFLILGINFKVFNLLNRFFHKG